MKILLVEDNKELVEIFKTVLMAQRYAVDVATNGQLGLELAESYNYDLIVLDVMLPKLDGISICRKLRSQGKQMPILMLTARSTKDDKVNGLDAGADDYLIKPPDLDELVARVRALLRRGQFTAASVLEWGDLRLDPNQCEVSYGDYPLHFTPKEYALLELFLRNGQRVYSRSALLEKLWSFDDEVPGEETIRSHVKGVRQKLRSVGAADLIETVYGLGYRLNPDYAQKTSQSASGHVPSVRAPLSSSAVIQSSIAQIWERSKPKILERLKEFNQNLYEVPLNAQTRQTIEQESHKLIGSLGAFGLESACQTARNIEQLTKSAPSQTVQAPEVRQLLGTLISQVDQFVLPVLPFGLNGSGLQISPNSISVLQGKQLLIVDDDPVLTELLATEATTYGLQVTVTATLDAAHAALRQFSFDGVVLDLALGEGSSKGISLLNYLAQQKPHLPVLVLTASDALAERMAVAQLNAKGFLQKPKSPGEVFDAIAKILQPSKATEAHILAVDDDLIHLKLLQTTLEEWGLQVTPLSDPHQFWDTLERTKPDLLILDVQMPDINGIQLCQTLRNDLKWRSLPVLFLTSCNDAEIIRNVFAAGADDYVSKPIVAPELIARLLNRLERANLLRNHREKDSLTDLSNRKRGTEELYQWVQLANSSQQIFSLAVLKVDHLQHINQKYGYPTGDQVLRRVSKLLLQELRKEDIVARWSGAEFVVGMYGMTRSQSVDWLAAILETFRQQELGDDIEQVFHGSFSAAVAQFPTDGITLHLLQQSARNTLNWIEKAGGDRVFPVTWQPPQSQPILTVDVLVIHPDQPFGDQLLQALETRGYHSQLILNQSTALNSLAGSASSLRANTILLAGNLPDFDGFHLFKHLQRKKVTKTSRVIFLLNDAEGVSNLQNSGEVDYILLPCSMSTIMLHLRQILER